MLLSCLHALFVHFLLCVTLHNRYVTKVLLGHQRFSSLTSDRIEVDSWKEHHCDRDELPDRLTYDSKLPSQINDLKVFDLTLTLASSLILTFTEKSKYSMRLDKMITNVPVFLRCYPHYRKYVKKNITRLLGH